jgi:hypothetical protein
MDLPIHLDPAQASTLLRSIGIDDPLTVHVVHNFNHVYQLEVGSNVFYLKTHTKGAVKE